MSWLYSRALVEAYLPASFLGGVPCAPSSSTPMPQGYSSPDRMKALSRLSRYGMTFAPLTADHGEAVLTSYLEDFPVRTSLPLAAAQASTASEAASGVRWPESSAKSCRATSSSRTARSSSTGGSASSSKTLPRSGTMRSGWCSEHATSELLTSVTAFGWWPTPTAGDAKSSGSRNTSTSKANYGVSLTDFVRMDGGAGRTETGGKLNPAWVEWLMGWPVGWAGLEPLETGRFQAWLLSHGLCSKGGTHE